MTNIARCLLKKGKEKPLLGRHPWIFSGAIDQIEDSCQPGDLVRVYSSDEKFLGVGYINPKSQIAVRMLAFEDVLVDENFFEKRFKDALSLRESFFPSPEITNAYRLVHAEGDFLPGLIVDRYGDYLVIQFLTLGMEKRKVAVVEALQRLVQPRGIFERSDAESRVFEGLSKQSGVLAGEAPPAVTEIRENSLAFGVDILHGQKTGFYLDQRENRKLAGLLARGRRVLNCFSYTAAFSVYAAAGGAAEVISVDSSQPALDLAKANFELNGLPLAGTFIRENAFDYLRAFDRNFDFIILDPPAFCKHKQQVRQAARGYKDINLAAFKKITSGGLLLTCSCSSYMTTDLFQKVVFAAAKDAGREVRILVRTGHALDHPVSLHHPEGEYLKALLCEVV